MAEQVIVLENLSWEALVTNDFLKQPFARAPLLNLDRLSIFQLLAENEAVAIATLPLGKLTYEAHYPFLKVLPLHETLQIESWPTYLLYNERTCTRAENILLAELKTLLLSLIHILLVPPYQGAAFYHGAQYSL